MKKFRYIIPCPPFQKNVDTICWWRTTAKEAIDQMKPLTKIIEAHGEKVKKIQTNYPGKILYQDKYQVVAQMPKRN